MRVLGIDYGQKRVGVAISDPMQIIASSHSIIEHDNDDEVVVDALLLLIEKYQIGKIVIGLPLNMNGSEGFQAKRVHLFCENLKERCDLPQVLEDERQSSKQAQAIKKEIKSKNDRIDDRAAAIILQNFLDYN